MILATVFELCTDDNLAAWRLYVAVQILPRLDLLDFIRSVVAGLLKTVEDLRLQALVAYGS